MTELVADNAISPFQAILWCLYPVGAIVFLELFLPAIPAAVPIIMKKPNSYSE